MPIHYVESNILESECTLITIPVNCIGTMGKGLALQAAKKWPYINEHYKRRCAAHEIEVGRCAIYYATSKPGFILFPTKKDWRQPSRLEYIEQGLQDLKSKLPMMSVWNVPSIAIPALGCGLGGLIWEEVRILLEYYLASEPIHIEVHTPNDYESKNTKSAGSGRCPNTPAALV